MRKSDDYADLIKYMTDLAKKRPKLTYGGKEITWDEQNEGGSRKVFPDWPLHSPSFVAECTLELARLVYDVEHGRSAPPES